MRNSILIALAVGWLVVADLSAVVDRPPKKTADPVPNDVMLLQGTWEFEALEMNGQQLAAKEIAVKLGNPRLVIKGNQLTCQSSRKTSTIPLKIDPTKNPKEIDLAGMPLGNRNGFRGTYVLNGDRLTTGPLKDNDRVQYRFVWRRVKP
jgi:uncharacterized protein (TIGR03067 family)